MFWKKNYNSEYVCLADCLKDIILRLSEHKDIDAREKILDEIEKELNKIDHKIQEILKDSFYNYCIKKKMEPYSVLYPCANNESYKNTLEDINNRLESHDWRQGETWQMRLHHNEYEKLTDWKNNKLKYMTKRDRYIYQTLIRTELLIGDLDMTIDPEKYNDDWRHPMDKVLEDY